MTSSVNEKGTLKHVVLLDTVSIQQYIFSSSKLKDNIGASELVQEIYRSYLEESLKEILQVENIDLNRWEEKPDEVLIKDGNVLFEVGYIGGGNALLFFQNQDDAVNLIKDWTKRLMIYTPGIVTAVACKEFDLDNFEKSKELLFKELEENKRTYIPQTVLPRHGITAECSRSGYSMECWNDQGEDSGYISSVINAKISAAKKPKINLEEEFNDLLKDTCCLPDQLDQLGHREGEDSHIAIVHIDGNNMAQKFRDTKTLEETRHLSIKIRKITRESVRKIIESITGNLNAVKEFLGAVNQSEDGKYYLPFRPIIIGGDDVTFVCNGKLGIYFAKIFLESFSGASDNNIDLSACAGIAITKTKYPFYRGYEMAEQLCRNAKEQRKAKRAKDSWLDFHIAYGGFSGSLDEIRESHYLAPQGDLLFRPYRLGKSSENDFHIFVKKAKELKTNFSKSKIMALREILNSGESAVDKFVKEMAASGLILPVIEEYSYNVSIWQGKKTPYFDMIELIEFYPFFESIETGEVNNA
jgi:hypothetical protein